MTKNGDSKTANSHISLAADEEESDHLSMVAKLSLTVPHHDSRPTS